MPRVLCACIILDAIVIKLNNLNNWKKHVKILFSAILFSFLVMFGYGYAEAYEIPGWVKSNAEWWAQDQIDDNTFVSGIEFLVKEGIIQIPKTTNVSSQSSEGIPGWIKNNADWWSQGMISDDDFIKGVQYLVENGIISVSQTNMMEEKSNEQGDTQSDWKTSWYGTLALFKHPSDWKDLNSGRIMPPGPENEFIGYIHFGEWYFFPYEKDSKMTFLAAENEKVKVMKTTIDGNPVFIGKGTSVLAQTPVNIMSKSIVVDLGERYQVIQIFSTFDSSKYDEYEGVVEKIINSFELMSQTDTEIHSPVQVGSISDWLTSSTENLGSIKYPSIGKEFPGKIYFYEEDDLKAQVQITNRVNVKNIEDQKEAYRQSGLDYVETTIGDYTVFLGNKELERGIGGAYPSQMITKEILIQDGIRLETITIEAVILNSYYDKYKETVEQMIDSWELPERLK